MLTERSGCASVIAAVILFWAGVAALVIYLS
jgi:hypothetical protein